jgi:hypothetical protein
MLLKHCLTDFSSILVLISRGREAFLLGNVLSVKFAAGVAIIGSHSNPWTCDLAGSGTDLDLFSPFCLYTCRPCPISDG